eukprot:scaffold85793_cov40-Attheya_sp.AAC.1
MKQFLGFFGVKENSISPFCMTFENANELRGAFMMYCSPSLQDQKQDEPSDDLGEKISDVAVENEMQNIEIVKSLIATVQKKMANAINDDEIVETGDHDTGDLDETEKDFPSFIMLWMGPHHWRNFVIVCHETRLKPRIKEEGSRVDKSREKIKIFAATLVHKRKLK